MNRLIMEIEQYLIDNVRYKHTQPFSSFFEQALDSCNDWFYKSILSDVPSYSCIDLANMIHSISIHKSLMSDMNHEFKSIYTYNSDCDCNGRYCKLKHYKRLKHTHDGTYCEFHMINSKQCYIEKEKQYALEEQEQEQEQEEHICTCGFCNVGDDYDDDEWEDNEIPEIKNDEEEEEVVHNDVIEYVIPPGMDVEWFYQLVSSLEPAEVQQYLDAYTFQ